MGLFDRWLKKDAVPDNRALERALRDLAQTDTAERRGTLYNLVKQSTLMLATPHANPDKAPKISDGSTEIGFIETVIINPNGPAGGYLTRSEIAALAEGLNPGAAAQDAAKEGFVLTPPEPAPPEGWIALLRSQARTMSAVRGLFVATASIGGGPPHYLVGVDLAAGAQPDAEIPALMQAIQSNVKEGSYVDFIPLENDSLADEIRAIRDSPLAIDCSGTARRLTRANAVRPVRRRSLSAEQF